MLTKFINAILSEWEVEGKGESLWGEIQWLQTLRDTVKILCDETLITAAGVTVGTD